MTSITEKRSNIKLFKVQAVGTTGAGDTFVGALSTMINAHFSFEDAIRYAMKAFSFTAQKMGTTHTFPRLEDLQ